MRKNSFLFGLGIVGTILISGFYYFFDPNLVKWMPKCPFKLLTSYDCPACGNQRAFHALLHGNIVEAFLSNPFLFLSFPYLVLLMVSCNSRVGVMGNIHDTVQHRITVMVYLLAICIWWIVRNVI